MSAEQEQRDRHRASASAHARRRWAGDEEFRTRKKRYMKEYMQRRKAAAAAGRGEQPSPPKRRSTVVRGGPGYVDLHVGGRIRIRRRQIGLSRGEVAEQLGVTKHQVALYEQGNTSLSAGKLHKMADILGVSVDWLFAELPGDAGARPAPAADDEALHVVRQSRALRLVQTYYSIPDEGARRMLLCLMRTVAGDGQQEEAPGAALPTGSRA